MEKLRTIGEIAISLNVPIHRVDYIVKAHAIAPSGRLGILRGFDAAAAERIRQLLLAMPARRTTAHVEPIC